MASGVDDGPARASLFLNLLTTIVCIAMGPRTSCLKSKLAWTSYRREAAVATFALTQTCRRGHDAVGNHLGAVLRRTRRVDGVEVDVHCARRRPSSAQRNDVDRSCPRDTPAPCEAAPGVRERGDGVQATAGVRRGAPRRGGRAPAPFSELHQSLRETIPSRSETAQIRKRNHPPP